MERINVFAIDDKGDGQADGRALVIRELSKEQENTIDGAFDKLNEQASDIEAAATPKWLKILLIIFGGACLFMLALIMGFIRGLIEQATEGIEDVWWSFPVFGILALIVGSLYFYAKRRRREHIESEEYKQIESDMEEYNETVDEILKVPENAVKTDVLLFTYKRKREKKKLVGYYLNFEVNLFEEDGNICLADGGSVYAIPINSVEKIVEIKKKICAIAWNKEDDKRKYKKQGVIFTDNDFLVYYKHYYSVRFYTGGILYEMFIPPHEIENFTSIIGLTPVVEKKL